MTLDGRASGPGDRPVRCARLNSPLRKPTSQQQRCRPVTGQDMDWQAAWSQDGRMESTPRQVPMGSRGPAHHGALDLGRSGHRRRPTGAPPPLPRSIKPTGVWWALAGVVLVTLAKIAFGPARRSLGVAVTVWDDALVRWLAGLRLSGLTGLMEAIVASTGSAGMIGALRWGTLLALLVLRRFRHLVVFVGSFLAVLLAVSLATVDRPRPFGVELGGSSASGSRPGWSRRSRWPASISAWTPPPTSSSAP